MQCLNCEKDSMPGNALCKECFDTVTQRKQDQLRAWDDNRQGVPHKAPAAAAQSTDGAPAQPTAATTEEPPVAPHLLRLLAFLCDMSVLYLLIALVQKVSMLIAGITAYDLDAISHIKDAAQIGPYLATINQMLAIQAASLILVSIAYFIGFECSPLRATPGKLLVGLSIIHLVESTMSADSAFKRFLVRSAPIWPSIILPNLLSVSCIFRGLMMIVAALVVFASLFVIVAEPISVLVTSNRQALHDIFARTQVIHRSSTGFIGVVSAFILMVLSTVAMVVIS